MKLRFESQVPEQLKFCELLWNTEIILVWKLSQMNRTMKNWNIELHPDKSRATEHYIQANRGLWSATICRNVMI